MSDARYDVFLSHSSKDKPLVRELAKVLKERGLEVFFDEWELVPGRPWQEALQAALRTAKSVAVLYGASGTGPWMNLETQASLIESVRRQLPIIPVLLPGFGDERELTPFLQTFMWVDFRSGLSSEGLDRLVWGITEERPASITATRGKPTRQSKRWNVPSLPSQYQPRTELEALKRDLLSAETAAVTLVGQRVGLAVQGMGGVGKTVLAAALTEDAEVQSAFPDGVFWLTFGQKPEDPLVVQARLAKAVGGELVSLKSIEDGKATLRELFADRACLLVLDDVWDPHHAAPFNVLGKRSKLLATTRKAEVGRGLGAEPHILGKLPEAEALALLARYARWPQEQLPSEAPELARACGGLPLALAMVGALLRDRPKDRIGTMLTRLRDADIARIKAALPDYPYDSLWSALEVSVADLPESTRPRYLDLAVFPEDVPISEGVLRTFWAPDGLDEMDVQEVVDTLVDRSLVVRDDQGRLTLHDLQYDYARARAGDLKPLHARLLAAYYRLGAEEGLHTVRDDGYFFQHIAHHVLAAEGLSSLRSLLFDFRWLAAKLAATETNALLADFQLLDLGAAKPARWLHDALRLSSHVLDRAPEELAGQLIGRLGDINTPEVRRLVESARSLAGRPGLIPLRPRLTPPGGPLVRTLEGHQNWVNAVALSADGRLALSGSEDQTLKLWDLTSGSLLRSFEAHRDSVNAVALSADGRLALSGSSDNNLKLWDLASGSLLRSFKGHRDSVNAVVLSADGRLALSGASDDTLKLWDLASGSPLRSFKGHWDSVNAVALSADGQLALSGSNDQTLKLWDLASGSLLRSFKGHRDSVNAVALSIDGRLALSGSSDNTLKLWDLASGSLLRSFEGHQGSVKAVVLSADGQVAVSGSEDYTLKRWDVASGSLLRSFEGHQDWVMAVALSADGQLALSGSSDYTLKLWNVASRSRLPLQDHRGAVNAVALSADGRFGLSGASDSTLKLWDLASGSFLRSFDGHHRRKVKAVALSADGRLALSGSSDNTLKLWDVASGSLLRSFEGHLDSINAVALSADGRLALSGSSDFTLKLWDVASGSHLRSFKGHRSAVNAVALSVDGRLALSGSEDYTLKLWNLASGSRLRSFEGHQGLVMAVALSADGRLALSGSEDNTLKLWDLASGSLLRSFEGHRDWVYAVALSADGQLAYSSSYDNTLKFWDLSSGRVLASFTGDGALRSLALSSDGRRVIAGDALGRLHLLEVRL